MQTIECRCLLVRSDSRTVLALAGAGEYRLPRIQIPLGVRPAQQVQRTIKDQWGLDILVLDTWIEPATPGCVTVAERITPALHSAFVEISVGQLATSELSHEHRNQFESIFQGRAESTLSQIGWIEEAMKWMACVTGRIFSSRERVEQWNGGGAFALLRVSSDDGQQYWFKATGAPNAHEFSITLVLAKLCPDYVPSLIAVRQEWNAWLVKDAGNPLPDTPSMSELVAVTRRMAQLQMLTIGHARELLAAGASDQRLPALRSRIDLIVAYLIDAMAQQTSTRVAPVSRDRLLALRGLLHDACVRLEDLAIPNVLIHNDLTAGNILSNTAKWVFTDWSEAAVGNPFLSCERLCQLNPAHANHVRNVYRDFWSHRLSVQIVEEAIAVTALVAIYAYLYGRGDWPKQAAGIDLRSDSYARSLARHMDKAAKDSTFLEALCLS